MLSQNPPEEVRTNVELLPNLVDDSWTDCEKVVASEISFGWKIARLWQLLKSRNKEYYIKSFLGMDVKESESNSEILPGSIVVPVELTESLKNIDAEKIDFFEKYLHFFSPTYLSSRELCNFWEKACISSIEGRSVKSAYRQPIDKIWLLARFFNVHFYGLDFVQSSRGLPSRLVKQIESLKNPSVLQNIMKEKIEHLLKSDQVPRWGGKGLPVEEIFATLASDNDFKDLQKKANEIYPEFQENPAKEVYEKAVPLKTSGCLLNKISFLSKRTDSDQVKEAKSKFGEDITGALSIIGKARGTTSDNYKDAMKLVNARISNLESNLHIEIDMERIEDRSKALSYIGIEVADALKAIPAPVEEVAQEPVQEAAVEQITEQQYVAETFEAKPSLWQRIKQSKVVRALQFITKIRIVVDNSNALPEGRGENQI